MPQWVMALPPVLSAWPPSPFDKHTSLLYQIRRGFLVNQLFRRARRNHFAPVSDIRRKGSGCGNVESEHHSGLGQPKFTCCAGIADGWRTRGDAENRREYDLHLRPARSDPLAIALMPANGNKAGNSIGNVLGVPLQVCISKAVVGRAPIDRKIERHLKDED